MINLPNHSKAKHIGKGLILNVKACQMALESLDSCDWIHANHFEDKTISAMYNHQINKQASQLTNEGSSLKPNR